MRKVIALFAAMMLLPMTAFGMQSMDQQEMSEVTGQSGVAITIDDVVLHESASETWYQNTYTDGDGNLLSQGAVGMVESGEQLTMVNAIVGYDSDAFQNAGNYGLQGEYSFDGIDAYAPGDDFVASPLTIKVGQFGALAGVEGTTSAFAQAGHTDATGVVVGLPTVEIHEDGATAMELLVSNNANPIGDTRDPATGVSSFGTIYTGESTMAVLDGRIEITPVEELSVR